MKHFSIEERLSGLAVCANRERLFAAIDRQETRSICREMAENAEMNRNEKDVTVKIARQKRITELKKGLTEIYWQAWFEGEERSEENAQPSGMVVIEIRKSGNVVEEYNHVEDKAKQLGMVASYVAPTADAVSMVFTVGKDETAGQTAERVAGTLGLTGICSYNEEMTYASRIVAEENWLFIDDQTLFDQDYPTGNEKSDHPPVMPEVKDELVRLLLSEVPEKAKAAVAHTIFPPLATHLSDVEIEELDGTYQKPMLNCVLMAKQSCGKNAVNIPMRRIMRDIDDVDDINRERERQYRALCKRMGKGQTKPEEPDDLIIRHLQANMTDQGFINRLEKSQGKTLFTSMNELDVLKKFSGAGISPLKLVCLAYDADDYGAERVSSNSVSGVFPMVWNWTASSTIAKGKRFLKEGLVDGTISRINFCTISKEDGQGKRYKFNIQDDAEYMAKLQPYIDNLTAARGRYSCKEALRMAERLEDKCERTFELTENPIYEQYGHRAVTIVLRKAMVLYIAHGCKWSEDIERLMEWEFEYDMWCKNQFFGQMLQGADDEENRRSSGKMENMLNYLDDSFTKDEAREMRVEHGKSENPTSMLNNWLGRGLIVRDKKTGMFKKIK